MNNKVSQMAPGSELQASGGRQPTGHIGWLLTPADSRPPLACLRQVPLGVSPPFQTAGTGRQRVPVDGLCQLKIEAALVLYNDREESAPRTCVMFRGVR
jgi:hypothetical protein